jgi:restriction endonuclease Mrr
MKYLVEVKHWRSGQGVGGKLLKEFVHVVANEQADGGLYLSTYGYASNAIEALGNVERRRIQMGAEAKVVGLCQMYSQVSGIGDTLSAKE